MIVRYFIDIPGNWYPHAEYVLKILFEGIGISAFHEKDISQANFIYSCNRPNTHASNIWIRADYPADWDNPHLEQIGCFEDMPVLYNQTGIEGASGSEVLADLVYSAYVLLTGGYETDQKRDRVGVPVFLDSQIMNSGILHIPVVAMYCQFLSKLLRKVFGNLPLLPLWPLGKKYAIVLSHDVDAPFSNIGGQFYLHKIYNRTLSGNIKGAIRSIGGLIRSSYNNGFVSDGYNDPNLCFRKWMELESIWGSKSCFYFASISSADREGTALDVSYNYKDKILLQEMQHIIKNGWEIGLHASIKARQSVERLYKEKILLERALDGYKIQGVRHHYWVLDKEYPEKTFGFHQSAGFSYDSSLGINDTVGFRRSMVWPFNLFDRTRKLQMTLLEIPPTLMDGAIFYSAPDFDEGARKIRNHIEKVFKVNGAVVLDWHLEQLNPSRLSGAGMALAKVLNTLCEDSDIFWATPAQLHSWWKERRQKLRIYE